jgi:hypothetical protein
MAFLEPIFGSANAERVLVYILVRGQGYAREIARFFDTDPVSIHKQLVKFEMGGILIANQVGRTVLYQFNHRYAFLPELKNLIEKSLSFYSKEERERLTRGRRRPRRRGKPM